MEHLRRQVIGFVVALTGIGVLGGAPAASAAFSVDAARAGGVPANLCKLKLASRVAAVPFVHNVAASCSTTTYKSPPSQGGRIEVATYGDPDFTVTVISRYSASFLAGIEQEYASGTKVNHLGVWARETSSVVGAQLEAHAGKVIVYVSVNGHGVTMYRKFKRLDGPLIAVARALLHQV